MADTDDKKAKKADKPQRSAKGEQAEKPARAAKPAKGEQGAKPAKGEAADGNGKAAPREPEQRVPARLRVEFDQAIRKKLAEQFGYKNGMQIPVLDKVVINMGIGEGVADRKKVELGCRRFGADFRPEGGHHQGAQVDRDLQGAGRAGHRLQGDLAQSAHVRVS